MTNPNSAAQAPTNNTAKHVLTDDEINTACDWPAANTTMRAENDRAMAREVEAAVLRELRAPVADERATKALNRIERRASDDQRQRDLDDLTVVRDALQSSHVSDERELRAAAQATCDALKAVARFAAESLDDRDALVAAIVRLRAALASAPVADERAVPRAIASLVDEIFPCLAIIDKREGAASGATEKIHDLANAIKRAALASAPVARERCKRCGGPGWYTSHTTGYPESIPCSACNPQGFSVERLERDPFLAAQLWRKPVDFADAYKGAREDLAIWKRRALEAERDLRAERETSSRLVATLNAENGATHMGEPTPQASAEAFDFVAHLARQAEFSAHTFGPGARVAGVCDHIRKELIEVETSGGDLKEWVDVIILGLDGAWRSGATPQEIIAAIVAKQAKNEARTWPDWRTVDPNKAIEHQRTAAPCTCPSGDGSLRHPCPAHPQGKPPAAGQSTDKEQA